MRTLFLCVASFSIIALTDAQLIRQCTCQEIESCKQKYFNSVKPCTDRCQKYAAALKADYKVLKGCILQREDMMRRTVECTQAAFPNACARTPGKFVPKRHLESIEIAGVAEINRMLSTTGVSEQVQGLLAQGRKFLRCTKSCLDRSASQCADKLKSV
ncbi:unnamed protein product [Toxocara canis]|uniref:Uncharacterized protein n=1 Tax=Toxocara canis TaxID=6265 RepID=A0A183VAM9_TOXCA|nr:unnamed protein product [Toxocara canis]